MTERYNVLNQACTSYASSNNDLVHIRRKTLEEFDQKIGPSSPENISPLLEVLLAIN
jgi:hypothetical protein